MMNPLTVRVYWEGTDAGGVEQTALKAVTGAIFVVAEVNLRYLAAAKLDDL